MTTDPTATPYFPADTWRQSLPEEQGIDSKRITQLFESLKRKHTNLNSLLIIRNGFLVIESYFSPHSRTSRHDVASVTKSVTSILVGSAIQHGFLENVKQRLVQLLPAFADVATDDETRSLTIEHLLSMTLGFRWNESLVPYGSVRNELTQMQNQADWLQFWATRSRHDSPGRRFNYNSGGYHVLSAVLQKQTGMTLAKYAEKNVFAPLGIVAYQWPTDADGVTQGSSHLCVSADALARIGYLMLNEGFWQGQQLIPQGYTEAATRRVTDIYGPAPERKPTRPLFRIGRQSNDLRPYVGYGYGWYLPSFGGFAARGFGGQAIFVLPDEKLIVVFTAHFDTREPFLPEYLMREYILSALIPAEGPRSDSSMAERTEASQALQQTIDALANPQSQPPVAPDAIAIEVSRRTYVCKRNKAGVRWFRVAFDNLNEALLEISINDRVSQIRLGLDFTFRLNPTVDGDVIGARATWVERRRFAVETRSTRTGGIFRMLFVFRNNRAVLVTQDESSKQRERIVATRDDNARVDDSNQ